MEEKHIHAEKLNTNKSNIIIKLLKKVSKQTNKKKMQKNGLNKSTTCYYTPNFYYTLKQTRDKGKMRARLS